MADVTKKPPVEQLGGPKDDKKPEDPKAKKTTEAEDLSEEDKQLQV